MGRGLAARPAATVGLPGAFKARFFALERGINNLARRCGESLPSPAARGTACLRRQASRGRACPPPTRTRPQGICKWLIGHTRRYLLLKHAVAPAGASGSKLPHSKDKTPRRRPGREMVNGEF